ncbi:MAG: hypothetical protein ABI723_21865 [Bacteroidia bacterium]
MLRTIEELSKDKFLAVFNNGEYLLFDTKQEALKSNSKAKFLLHRILMDKKDNDISAYSAHTILIAYKFFNPKNENTYYKLGKIKCVELIGYEEFWKPKQTYGIGSTLQAKFLDSEGNLEKIKISCMNTLQTFPKLISFMNSLSEINNLQIAKMMGFFDKDLKLK